MCQNTHILNGSNILVNFESEALQNFFPERHHVPLLEVLATVNRHSGFLDEFQHWQQRYNRARPPQKAFYAGIIGLGCGIGTRKMARISRQINEHELEHTVNWFFSPEGTHAANDRVLRLIDSLGFFAQNRKISDDTPQSITILEFESKN